ncbi:ATP-binding protein [Crocinitomicaceae bacterium]|nr:ATP-binding protein [Crocinitomicaceae bacterium]
MKPLIDISYGWIFIAPLLSAIGAYVVFYLFIKKFITEKLKVLYRSIRKGKFENPKNETFSLRDDLIEIAEMNTKNWTDEKNSEISQLKAQAQFRKEFIGNLAHELKTPVFSIQGYILTLLEGGLEDGNVNRKFLERASKATDRMTTILEDLDLLTKLEVNRVHLELTNFDIKELIIDIFEELEIKAKKKNIVLKFAKEFDPIHVFADRTKIGQVLMNLINNSIHYGENNGETQVRFYTFGDIVTIEVSDNGAGIDEMDLPRLFERFYRVEKSRNRNEGGSGLGLAIAKHFIEAHGQTINVRSTINVGSTFTFSLDKGKSTRT